MTIPVTTPIPKATEKMRVQKLEILNHTSLRVKKNSPSSTAIYDERPTVRAGNNICQPITQAH
jgi:hypothetical protein